MPVIIKEEADATNMMLYELDKVHPDNFLEPHIYDLAKLFVKYNYLFGIRNAFKSKCYMKLL
jgi:hypothetical protein